MKHINQFLEILTREANTPGLLEENPLIIDSDVFTTTDEVIELAEAAIKERKQNLLDELCTIQRAEHRLNKLGVFFFFRER